MKKFLLLFVLMVFSSIICFAQDDSTSTDSTDSWNDNNEHEWSHDWSHEWSTDDFEFGGRPTIETPYGIANIGLKSINSKFMKAGIAEIRLGFAKVKDKKDNIIKYSNKFLLVSNLSTQLNSQSKNTDNLEPEMWRIGFGGISGYGYNFGDVSIIPYTSSSFAWTRLNLKNISSLGRDSVLLTPSDKKTLELFNESFRFGTMSEGGIRIQVIPVISLNAGYERSVVFPRFLFWKFAGSVIIEGIANGAIDKFVEDIMENSPSAGPIVNFVLKNALSYGIYQLRHDKMNWPFKTVEPLYTDTWKVGLTFTF